jgi:hypothetical protein
LNVFSLFRSVALVFVLANAACGLELEGSFLVESAPDAGDAGKPSVTKDASVEAAVLTVVDSGSVVDVTTPTPLPPAPPVYQWSCVKIAKREFDLYTQCEMARRNTCTNAKGGTACAVTDLGKPFYNGCDGNCWPSPTSSTALKYTDGSDERCTCEKK